MHFHVQVHYRMNATYKNYKMDLVYHSYGRDSTYNTAARTEQIAKGASPLRLHIDVCTD